MPNENVTAQPMTGVVVELDDMSAEAQAIIAAGSTMAGSFPSGLTKPQLIEWMKQKFRSAYAARKSL